MIPLDTLGADRSPLLQKDQSSKIKRGIIGAVVILGVIILVALFSTRSLLSHPEDQEGARKSSLSNCKYSIVGSGYGGVYFAYRLTLSEHHIYAASDFCIFEASSTRVGGRPFSYTPGGIWDDLTVELGAYRFQTSQQLVNNLAVNVLNASVTCWNGDSCSYLVFRDPYGNNKGYVNGILDVLQMLYHAGMPPVYMDHELTNVIASENPDLPIRLIFRNGQTVDSAQVLLNIPAPSIKRLAPGNLIDTAPELNRAAVWNTVDNPGTKQYIWYDDAWWISKLNKTSGTLSRTYADGIDPPAISIRYADGPVKCKRPGETQWSTTPIPGGICKGALAVVYSWGGSSNYAIKYEAPGQSDAATLINSGGDGSSLLTTTHNKLMSLHSNDFQQIGINPDTIALPPSLALSHWNASHRWNTPSYHRLTTATGSSNSDSQFVQRNRVLIPNPDYDLFIANEAWSNSGGWAEGSFILAERLLAWRYKLPKQAPITDAYYTQTVTPYMPAPQDCFTNNDCIPVSANFHSEQFHAEQCLAYTCVDQKCVTSVKVGAPCDNGNLCTVDETCRATGECVGIPIVCESPMICVAGSCMLPDPPSLPKCSYREVGGYAMNLYWEYVGSDEIRFAFSLPGRGYAGLGIGTSMLNADMVVGWVQDDGTFRIDDYWSVMSSIPNVDTFYGGTRDIYDIWGTYNLGVTTIYFQRKLRTGDIYDNDIIPNQVNNFIYAFGSGEPGTLIYHQQFRGQLAIDLSCHE